MKKLSNFLLAFTLVLFLTGCVTKNTTQDGNDNTTILKLASWGPKKHYIGQARDTWIKDVNRAAKGKIKIIDFPGGQLFGPKEMHIAIKNGSVDIGVTLQPAMLDMVPLLGGTYLPFAFDDLEQATKAYSGQSLDIINNAFEKKGLKLLYVNFVDPLQIFSTKKNIEKIPDFRGLRILSSNSAFSKVLTKLGAVPDTTTPYTYSYLSLKNNLSDATFGSTTASYFSKLYEVAPYLTQMNFCYTTILVCMNLKKWDILPEDVKQIMINTGKKQSDITIEATKKWEARFIRELASHGISISRISENERKKIKEISKQIWKNWADENGENAYSFLKLNGLL